MRGTFSKEQLQQVFKDELPSLIKEYNRLAESPQL